MSSVYEVSCSAWETLGLATNVPLPWMRSSRPSTTSSWSAWRTVVREVSNSAASVRSGGTGVPGGSVSVMSSKCRFSR
jgi:hypothetical protein